MQIQKGQKLQFMYANFILKLCNFPSYLNIVQVFEFNKKLRMYLLSGTENRSYVMPYYFGVFCYRDKN